MEDRFHSLLKTNSSANDDHNFILGSDHSKWHIPQEKLNSFWSQYSELIWTLNEKDSNYYSSIYERPCKYTPFVIHCNLRFKTIDVEKQSAYNDDFIFTIAYVYQQLLMEKLDIKDSDLRCVFLENKVPVLIDSEYLVSFRIHFPYLKTDSMFHESIFSTAVQRLRDYKITTKLPISPTNTIDKMIDPLACMKMYLYCGTPSKNHKKLERTGLYGVFTEDHLENEFGPGISIKDFYNPSDYSKIASGEIKNFIMNNNLELWMPLLLSNDFSSEIKKERIKEESKSSTKIQIRSLNLDDQQELLQDLWPKLDVKRYSEKHYWLDLGRCCFNIYKGTAEGLSLWVEITEQGDQFSREDCENWYSKLEGSCLSVKTIAWYVKEDNPEFFNLWSQELVLKKMNSALSMTDNDIASCLYYMYWLEFLCKSKKDWYHYKDHRWHYKKDGISIRKLMSSEMHNRFEQLRSNINTVILNSKDLDEKNNGELKIKNITNLMKLLKGNASKTKILSEAVEFFGEDNFEFPFDCNSELLGVSNGVIEICDNHAIFRIGKPEDYITKSTKVPLEVHMSENAPSVRKLKRWLGQVFVNSDLRHFFLKLAASKLRGRNSNKVLEIWTGKGNNSKSMVVKLHEKTFGSYFNKLPTAVLTAVKKTSSGACPELAQTKGSRIACLQEPDDDTNMQTSTIKELTGGDAIFARALFDNGGMQESLHKTILMCNRVPGISGIDQAVIDRLLFIPFFSRWIGNPPEDESEQYRTGTFKLVNDFELQIMEMSKAFLWLIFNYYDKYVEEGIMEQPACVKEFTNKYWNETDPFNQFYEERLKEIKNAKGEPDTTFSIGWAELKTAFFSWYKESYQGFKIPSQNSAKARFETKLGPQKNRKWIGLQLTDK